MPHPLIRRGLSAGLAASVVSLALAVPAHAATGALLAGAPVKLSAAVGERFDATLSVTNTGSTAVDGVAVRFATTSGFEAAEQFANCVYEAGQPRDCTFEQSLEPGKSYQLVMPYKVRADAYAPGGLNGQFQWTPLAGGTPHTGDGAVLQLRAGDKLGESPAGDWQYLDVAVTGSNGADLAALGTTVTGAAGDVVEAEVGVRNDGPATLDWTRGGTSPGLVVVTIPAGTSVVKTPEGCDRDSGQYVCETATLFPTATTTTWKFPLRINQVVAGATGSVEVNPACQCQRFDKDLDKSNNTASLVVNPADDTADQIPPVIDDTGLVAGQLVPSVYYFRPVAHDNVGVTKLEAVLNGTQKIVCSETTCRVVLPTGRDADGTITVRAYDAAGNHSGKTIPVHLDSVAPTGSLTPAAKSSMRTGPVNIAVDGVAADTAKIVMVDAGTRAELATRTEAPWTFSWDAVDNTVSPLFVITDRAGNSLTRASGYIVDNEAPVIERADFAGSYSTNRLDAGTGWVGGISYVNATIADESPISRSEWRVDGVLKSTAAQFYWDARAIPAATATVEVRVWDAAGNTSSKAFRVNIDKAAPTMSVSPAPGALVRGTSYVTFLKATDRSGIAYVQLTSPNSVGQVASVRLAAGKDGPRSVTWLAIDKLGNYTYVKRSFTIDNTAPAVAFKSAPKSNAKLSKKVTLTATAGDRNGVARVQLLVNGKAVATDTKAGYAFTLNPKAYGRKFTVQLRAYDKAGNLRYSVKRNYRR
ncbi:Ig-like domain-containing protein [Actinoplanes sp. NPDC048988]|uniref:Ig-like domain-containing protein n=1 Tax=Actinoplanes sp. NPDC048988 TaxID=3363901 RepID=UPI003713C61A